LSICESRQTRARQQDFQLTVRHLKNGLKLNQFLTWIHFLSEKNRDVSDARHQFAAAFFRELWRERFLFLFEITEADFYELMCRKRSIKALQKCLAHSTVTEPEHRLQTLHACFEFAFFSGS
jgi:hypothetical protein